MHIRLETLPTTFRYVDLIQKRLVFSPFSANIIGRNKMLQWQAFAQFLFRLFLSLSSFQKKGGKTSTIIHSLSLIFLWLILTTQQELFTVDYHYRLRFLWNLPNESYSFLNESLMGTSINDFLKETFCLSSFFFGIMKLSRLWFLRKEAVELVR